MDKYSGSMHGVRYLAQMDSGVNPSKDPRVHGHARALRVLPWVCGRGRAGAFRCARAGERVLT